MDCPEREASFTGWLGEGSIVEHIFFLKKIIFLDLLAISHRG